MTNPTADLTAFPPVRVEPDARRRIRTALADAGRRIAVLDDDPTGSQTVHDVAVVTVFDPDEIAAGLDGPGSTCFILTNTRSMGEADAVALNTRVGRMLFELSRRLDAPIDVISRSDSTLRGHVIAEVTALGAVRREVLGRGYDGVLLVPAYLEAGRFTAGDVHWARVGGEPQPVGETEFARDATFGFSASNLREFVAEKSDHYWTGTGTMPKSTQYGAAVINQYAAAFAAPTGPPLDSFSYLPYTHAVLSDRAFRRGTAGRQLDHRALRSRYVALWSWRPVHRRPVDPAVVNNGLTRPYDLVVSGGPDNVWITEVGDAIRWAPSTCSFVPSRLLQWQ